MSVLENGKPAHVKPAKGPRLERQYASEASITSLTAEEKALIREQARETVIKELKDQEEKALLDIYVKEARQELLPEEQTTPIWLNLSPHMDHIRLDDKMYLNETVYYVPPAVFSVLTEQMARGWAHEDQTEVRDARTRRRARIPVSLATSNFGDNRLPRDLKVSSGQLAGSRPEALLGMR